MAPRDTKHLYAGFAEARWPKSASSEQAELGFGNWLEAVEALEKRAERDFAKKLAQTKAGKALLGAIFGNSPYLSDSLTGDPEFAIRLLQTGPDKTVPELLATLNTQLGGAVDQSTLMSELRHSKRRLALAVALADIGGLWPLEKVTRALSDCADLSLSLAARHLLRKAAADGTIKLKHPKDPERGSGLVILGMGKHGARELNYSSDIDFIVFYDPERIVTDDPDALQSVFVRLTHNLVRILEERRPEGYVFRTDLRLRPDPGATPAAMTTLAAEAYYESLGQNWERAAMIKARIVAGDREAGAEFLRGMVPFIWRKNLDFAAIQDIHSIKRQINAHHGGAEVAIAGHNIKLGRGGIREVEFFAQTQQLIWGGRSPELRPSGTCEAITALTHAGRVKPETARDMIASYEFHRRVEHRLQMIDDKQTQELPSNDEDLDALATFLGYARPAQFRDDLHGHLTRVERHYAELFEEAPELSGPGGNLVFTGTDDDPATLETLTQLGFSEPTTVAATVRGWHHGRYRAMRSVRARELLTELMPSLLQAIGRTAQPDTAFARFDQFLSRLPAGVQLFSLFHSNPALLDLVADVMGDAPRLADLLSSHTHLLDSVLSPEFLLKPPDLGGLTADLERGLRTAADFQDVLDVLRRWKSEREFQIGVQLLRGVLPVSDAGAVLADVAEATLAALQIAAELEFTRLHGTVKGGAFAIVAFGKLGGREMTVTSDLDIMFLWNAPANVETSSGGKPLPISLYYQRFAQRLITAITVATGEGTLYELDLRLRPSGNKGPIATNLDGFVAYQRDDAWTWEHLALTRARAITGHAAFRDRIGKAIRDVLTRKRDSAKLTADVADMRARMAAEQKGIAPWEIKHWRGGLIDVEFIAQYLQLRHAAAHPDMLATNTAEALARAIKAKVLGTGPGRTLTDALRLWQVVQGLLRLTIEGVFEPDAAPPGLKAALARAAGAADFAALEAQIRQQSALVLDIFNTLIPHQEGARHGSEEENKS